MLVLSRQSGERIMIGENIIITICEIRGDNVRIGIEAPPGVSIDREEIYLAKKEDLRREVADSTTTKPGVLP